MRKIVFGLLVIGGIFKASAQQSPQYTQYMVNPYLMNPALASVEDMIDIKTGYRAQWLGFNESFTDSDAPGVVTPGDAVGPRTMYLSGHSPIGKPHAIMHYVTEHKSWFGAGGKVVYDKTGPSTWGSYMVSGTYNMGIIKPKGSGIYTRGGLRMSAGAFLGIQQYSLTWRDLNFAIEDEPLKRDKPDVETNFKPDATVGVWFYNNFLFFGFSMDHVFGNEIYVTDIDLRKGSPTLARHSFLTGGINYEITEQITWSPSILMKFTPNAPLSMDFNNKITYEDSYWGGITYRHMDAISIAMGAIITYNYEIAYSYDYTTTDIKSVGNASATHEITLGYRIAPKPTSMNAEDHNWGHNGHYKKKKYK